MPLLWLHCMLPECGRDRNPARARRSTSMERVPSIVPVPFQL